MSYSKQLIPPQAPPPEIMTRMRPARMTGYIVVTLWALLGLALLAMMVSNWDNEKFFKYGPRFLHGLMTTLELVAFSIVFGALLSVPLAFARMSKNRILSGFAYVYVYVFRGTPILAQLFLIYYGLGGFRPEWQSLGLWWFFREAWFCGLLSLTLNTAAYQTEILRGAIISVHRGQHEAAASLGIHKLVAFYKIILPQALIVALRPYGNEVILMVKGSAVVAIITVFDLMGETRYAFSQTYDYQTYLWAAIFYLTIVEILRHLLEWSERRLTRHLIR